MSEDNRPRYTAKQLRLFCDKITEAHGIACKLNGCPFAEPIPQLDGECVCDVVGIKKAGKIKELEYVCENLDHYANGRLKAIRW